MITGRQIRAARALLDMSQDALAEETGLTPQAIRKIENGDVQPREGTIADIMRAVMEHGVEFTADEGVKRRSDSVTVLEGFEDFKSFMDQVYEAALDSSSHDGTKPICICDLDNNLFKKHLKDYHSVHVARLKKLKNLEIRCLAAEVDRNHIPDATYLTYRYLNELKTVATPFYVFGDKFALIDFNSLNPPRILMIQSPLLARSYRDQFEVMWKNAADE